MVKGLVIYKGVATQIGLGIFFSFFFFSWWGQVRSKDERVDLGEMENKCVLGALIEIPK